MIVRTATIEDLDILIDFGQRLTKESPHFQKQGFNVQRAEAVFIHLINKGSIFIVYDQYDNAVGGLIGCMDIDWRTGHKLAFEQGVFVLPEYRSTGVATQLVEAFKAWAIDHHADRIQIGTMTGIYAEKTVSLYEGLGFELKGFVLEMEV